MIQTGTIRPFPVILVGEREWDGLVDWLREHALADHRIEPSELALLHLARDPSEVVEIVTNADRRQRRRPSRQLP